MTHFFSPHTESSRESNFRFLASDHFCFHAEPSRGLPKARTSYIWYEIVDGQILYAAYSYGVVWYRAERRNWIIFCRPVLRIQSW